MLDQLDQKQVSTAVPLLSALLEHPEFQRGLADGHEFFHDSHEEALLTEEEMLGEVEGNLSRRIRKNDQLSCRMMGEEPSSYFYLLGCVLGTVDQALTYAS